MSMELDARVIKALVPKLPLIGKTAFLRTLGLSEQSKYWDLRTEITINILRSFLLDDPVPISRVQKVSFIVPEVKGKIWLSRVTMPIPAEDHLRQSLFSVIEGLKEPGEPKGGYIEPEFSPVEAEWTGYRAGATNQAPELQIPEEEKYKELMKEVTSPTTVMYFHGGAYYMMDPATHRPTAQKLAKLTKGRVFNVRYRLAPQNPFPSALLDALVAYFSLLYPQSGSLHDPVDPKHIVFAGDSAGGNLSFVLLQTLLEFRRQGLKIHWNGEEREVPLPAAVATCSAWADVTHSSPSCETNKDYDYVPPKSAMLVGQVYPKDDVWPSTPPRNNLYAEDAMLCHPLVSPVAVKNWEGSCPLWISTGQEILADEVKLIATKAAGQGVKVVFEEWASMPHCFALVLENIPASGAFFTNWAKFITTAVERPEEIKTMGTKIQAKTFKEEELDVDRLCDFTEEDMKTWMRATVSKLSQRSREPLSKL